MADLNSMSTAELEALLASLSATSVMDILIATGHITGAIIVIVAIGIGIFLIGAWEAQQNQRLALEETSQALGITIEELDNDERILEIIQFSSSRFSSELFRNRFSDLCGLIRISWGWLGATLQLVIMIFVVWYTINDDLGIAIYAWSIVAVELFFWIASVLFALACKLLTGRYPGQAKQARKSITEFIKNQRAKQVVE